MSGDDPDYHDDASKRGLRSEGRDSLYMLAQIRVAGGMGSETIRVRNLSASGLMAEASVQYAVGTQIIIELKNVPSVPGRVVWATDGRMGISFDGEIDPKAVRQKVSGDKTGIPSYLRAVPLRRPGLKFS